MANYSATARTNYFRIKERAAFDAWVDTVCYQELSIIEKDGDPLRVGLNATSGDCSGFSINYEDEDGEEQNLLEGLAQHLAEGEVAILVESGAEKCRNAASNEGCICVTERGRYDMARRIRDQTRTVQTRTAQTPWPHPEQTSRDQ